MKIDIIVVYVPRYPKGHEKDFVPPITGIHLAALTPKEHEVRVFHQQIEPINYDTDADLIALSYTSGFADEARRVATAFRERGKLVVAGGAHASFWPEETLKYCDAVVLGEAESAWPQLIADAEKGRLQPLYKGEPRSLEGLPRPRYDLLPDNFFIKRVVQATRGCPFSCSFCCVPSFNPGFRMRPVSEVIRDIEYDDFPHWWQRKVVWFWDDNLTAKRSYIKELLTAMIPLKRWWLTQASMDIARDEELLDLMERSGCIGIFLGIETFGKDSLKAANKPHNQIARYRQAIEALHKRGIAVMAGFIAGFDGDTPETIVDMADHLLDIGVDVPFLSVLTPYKGTPLYDQMEKEDRLIQGLSSGSYNGYNVAFRPEGMAPYELLQAHRKLWAKAFSPWHSAKRILRAGSYLRAGSMFLTTAMNGFYGLKSFRGNGPTVFDTELLVQDRKEKGEVFGLGLSTAMEEAA